MQLVGQCVIVLGPVLGGGSFFIQGVLVDRIGIVDMRLVLIGIR